MANAEMELAVQMSHLGTEHWKILGRLIGYLKGKETKGIIIRNPKVMKLVIFCDSNYATDKDTRKSVSGLVATLEGTLLTYFSKTHRNLTLSCIEAEYVVLTVCSQEVNFVSVLMGQMTKVQNTSIIYEDNQGTIFLANNRQVGICTKHIDICHHFLWDIVEDKYIGIKYIRS